MVGTIICEVGTIICDIGTINVRFYLLEVRYVGTVELPEFLSLIQCFCIFRKENYDANVNKRRQE